MVTQHWRGSNELKPKWGVGWLSLYRRRFFCLFALQLPGSAQTALRFHLLAPHGPRRLVVSAGVKPNEINFSSGHPLLRKQRQDFSRRVSKKMPFKKTRRSIPPMLKK